MRTLLNPGGFVAVALCLLLPVAWDRVETVIPDGRHMVRWTYEKDGSISVGEDAGWVDQVSYHDGSSGVPVILTGGTASGVVGRGFLVETVVLGEVG